MLSAAAERQKSDKRMNIKKYNDDFIKLGISNIEEQVEIFNSLLRLAIIAQNNYNKQKRINSNEE